MANFSDKFKPKPSDAPKVVASENDFPFARVISVSIGSAHAVAQDQDLERRLHLMMRKLVNLYPGDGIERQVQIDRKTPIPPGRSDASAVETVTVSVPSAPPQGIVHPLELSLVERTLAKNLYLCVKVEGADAAEVSRYAYFGIFTESFHRLVQHLGSRSDMNPKDFHAIVLARSTGLPSPEIREFMRMKFSFDDKTPVLEIGTS